MIITVALHRTPGLDEVSKPALSNRRLLGSEKSGAQSINGDAILSPLVGQLSGKVDNCTFGSRVLRDTTAKSTVQSHHTQHRGNVYYATVVFSSHELAELPTHEEQSGYTDVYSGLPLFEGQVDGPVVVALAQHS